jgi:eukaryotic-like serine/threonine-protein kinase
MVTSRLDEAAIFNVARQIKAPEDRRRYIQHACGGDKDVQARVEALLRVHEEENTFLDSPTQKFCAILGVPAGEGPGTQIGPYKLLEQIG